MRYGSEAAVAAVCEVWENTMAADRQLVEKTWTFHGTYRVFAVRKHSDLIWSRRRRLHTVRVQEFDRSSTQLHPRH